MHRKKILVIGSLNMDWVINVSNTPVEGETVLGKSLVQVPGGKGANQAYAAAKLQGDVTMVGVVGKDEIGEKLINNLKKVNVDTSHIAKDAETQSGLAVIYVNDRGNNSIVVLSGANEKCTKSYINECEELIKQADILILQMEIPQDSVFHAIDIAHKYGKTIILNPAPAPENIDEDILSKLDYITPNETELEKLSGLKVNSVKEADKAAHTLIEKGVKNVLVTLGSKGALLKNKNQSKHFETKKVNAVDTTAAGDSFNAAFAVYLAEGNSVEESICFANKVSTITVQRKGAQSSIPNRCEVK